MKIILFYDDDDAPPADLIEWIRAALEYRNVPPRKIEEAP